MVTIHQQPISFSIPQADGVFGSFIHCETVAQGRRIHNGKPTFVSVCQTAIVLGKADSMARGHFLPAPDPCEPTVIIFTDDWLVCP
jgi:hypothetical protein